MTERTQVSNVVNPNQMSLEGIEPVKTTATKRKPFIKEVSKRILHAVGNGLRTSESIANALNVPRAKVQSNLWHLKDRGLVHGVRKDGSKTVKYYLTTEQPKLDGEIIDTVPKRIKAKTKRKYTKRKTKVVSVEKTVNVVRPYNKEMETKLKETLLYVDKLEARVNAMEQAFHEKEKETWVLESEVHDLKAIIRYLENKAN